MNKNEKRDCIVEKIRKIADSLDGRISTNAKVDEDSFIVEILKDYKSIDIFFFRWNMKKFTFECAAKKISTKITSDNIHLYYEFMSDEDRFNYKVDLTFKFESRKVVLFNSLFEDKRDSVYFNFYIKNGYILAQDFFNIKDTLKPIDEYIAEIKESEAYKEYISTK